MSNRFPLSLILSPGGEAALVMFSHYATHNGTNWGLIDQDYGIEEAIRILRNEGDCECPIFWEKLQRAERWKACGVKTTRRPSIAAAVDTLRSFAAATRGEESLDQYPTLLIAKRGSYTLKSQNGRYVMKGGRYGAHSLDIESTSASRLKAHWASYQRASQ